MPCFNKNIIISRRKGTSYAGMVVYVAILRHIYSLSPLENESYHELVK